MSEQLAQLEKKGGMSETVLWTNPSTASTFASQQVTLSKSLDNFKQLAFYFNYSKNNSNVKLRVVYDVDLIKTFIDDVTHFVGSCTGRYGADYYSRVIYYVNATHILFGGTWQMRGTVGNNDYIIPTKITGLS